MRKVYPKGASVMCLAIAAALGLTGCFLAELLPDTKTAIEHAHEMAPRCSAFGEDAVRPLLAPSLVESVQPAYTYISSGPADREARLRGARLHLRPVPSVTRETLARSLVCHQARALLGETQATDSDPYVEPGVWLRIDADSDGDGFVVDVRTDVLPTAKDVLHRARLLVATSR